MKQLKKMMHCLETILKKNFFNVKIDDFPHDCELTFGFEKSDANKANEAEEYMDNYKATTRWQTV